ncbi:MULTISPECIES: glycosyltransferase family 2 protein [unclassified Flavobacterium]|uniref:glycosyltransferase n=1 Tax=unclassified Flavobacterium TaxID=196869 RepID=UPI001F149094|nr:MULTISPECIES: glycosyltransferase [unclassified Flavobacterium]UMY64414.1 glycosyltransferase [Flavobacterium sp. HJ-32-4]
MYFSLVVPVYNRPDETRELLESLAASDYGKPFEVVIVEDGSTLRSDEVVAAFTDRLDIRYFSKENSGPGDSRNFGMEKARGDYFLIFDSDCLIPSGYLSAVADALASDYVDCFGGPDAAHESFTDIQKAINFTMTSFLTTGGVRGGSEKLDKFQPRSFNMGLSRRAFEASGGFGDIHPGEDPDLSIRLWKMGFRTRLVSQAFVYHKRRIDWRKFYIQVGKFGKVRPILDQWYPEYAKLTYFFPSAFLLGFITAVVLVFFDIPWLLYLYEVYFVLLFLAAAIETRRLTIAFFSLIAVAVQFYGYGWGFIRSFLAVRVLRRDPRRVFPTLFFTR